VLEEACLKVIEGLLKDTIGASWKDLGSPLGRIQEGVFGGLYGSPKSVPKRAWRGPLFLTLGVLGGPGIP